MTSHPDTNFSRDAEITTSRHACYRQLARAILGPLAPHDDIALVHALAEHARFITDSGAVAQRSSRRAA